MEIYWVLLQRMMYLVLFGVIISGCSGVEESSVEADQAVFPEESSERQLIGSLNTPVGLKFGPDGALYVASYEGNRVLRIDGQGAEIYAMMENYTFRGLAYIVFGPDGQLYAGSQATSEILVRNADGIFTLFAPVEGLVKPTGMAFGEDGHLYVACQAAHKIFVLDVDTKKTIRIIESEIIKEPTGIAFSPDGRLFVSSSATDAIILINEKGEVHKFASGQELSRPDYLFWGPDGRLFVSSYGKQQILALSADGKKQSVFSDEIYSPTGLDFGPDGRLYVNSFYGNAIFVIDKDGGDSRLFIEGLTGENQKNFLANEKKQLEATRENQALALALKEEQLRVSLLIGGLIGVIALGAVIGFYYQQRSKKILGIQNGRIQRQAEQLKKLDEAKSRFFANISHELRTPLSLMMGPVASLENEGNLTPQQQRLLALAQKNGKELEGLITQMLDLSKLETGNMFLVLEPTLMQAYFRQYLSLFESLAIPRDIDYIYSVELEDGLIGEIDRDKCRQIIHILLSNVFKRTKDHAQIRVSVEFLDNQLEIKILGAERDTHSSALPNINEHFYGTYQTKRNTPKSIELALCKEYIQLLRGQIEIVNDINKEAGFIVRFPFRASTAPAQIESISIGLIDERTTDAVADKDLTRQLEISNHERAFEGDSGVPFRITILVVEDNFDLQEYLRLILKDNYNVVVKNNGKEGLQWLQEGGDCQLILSDLVMPVMDGYQFVEKLKTREATRSLPIFVLTAKSEMPDKLRALRIGIDDYIVKPFDHNELLARMSNLVKNWSVRQKIALGPESPNGNKAQLPIDDQWLASFEKYVIEHIKESTLSVLSLANTFAMSESTLSRQLKRVTGLTPGQYIINVRLTRARELLARRNLSTVREVASAVGYTDVGSFSRSFKVRFGVPPSQLMKH